MVKGGIPVKQIEILASEVRTLRQENASLKRHLAQMEEFNDRRKKEIEGLTKLVRHLEAGGK